MNNKKSTLILTPAQALVFSGAYSLPTDLGTIAEYYGIKCVSYADCADIYDITPEELYRASRMGLSFISGGQYVCAINENACGDRRRRWTLAHEIAHCMLGHLNSTEQLSAERSAEEERCANRFAAELLSPLTVLHFAGVSSAQQLSQICGLSAKAGEIRFRELCTLRRKAAEEFRAARLNGQTPPNAFLQTEDDRRLAAQFMPFITNEICKRTLYNAC